MNYAKIKSKFIKEELKKTKWGDNRYIDDLMYIEKFASGETFGMATMHIINRVKSKYPKQWKKIWMEINPKGYKEMIEQKKKEEKKEKQEDELFKKEQELQLKKEKQEWQELGGKL